MNLAFLFSGVSIVLIDLMLGADNALMIGMAVRALPQRQRGLAIASGATGAVILRIILTALAARLLKVPLLQLAGGVLVLATATKMLIDAGDPHAAAPAPRHLLQAIGIIAATDLAMSFDNILAIAGASHGNVSLIVFGLGLSIPFVIFFRHWLSTLMDRYPVLIYLGGAILAKVAGDMMMEDPFLLRITRPSAAAGYLLDAFLMASVLVTGIYGGRAGRMLDNRRASV